MCTRNKSDVHKLFEVWCLVTSPHSNANKSELIMESYPKSYLDQKTLSIIPEFAFPCEYERDIVESYSFVLTTVDSIWRYGFCRYDPKTKTAMVILTFLPWHDTFLQLLTVLADLRRQNDEEFKKFLTEAYHNGLPDPGLSSTIHFNNGERHFEFKRPLCFELPKIPQNHNLNLYYNFADAKSMIGIFAAMLAERRIIFTSRELDRLSACTQAASAFLYPMVWQHIFVPLLPMHMKEYLGSPTPFLCGVPETVLQTVDMKVEVEDVVIFYCDTNRLETPFDDMQAMPTEIVSQMKKQLSQSNDLLGDRISKIFLEAIVQLIGSYRDAIEFNSSSAATFNFDKFIETRPSHLQPFLKKMNSSQIFRQFIDERSDMIKAGLGYSDDFELAIARYTEKTKKPGTFIRNLKEKTNPAVKSAVKSVKEGSRGVKSAYKDLKSKFRDITPPSSSSTQFHSPLSISSQQRHRVDGKPTSNTLSHRSAPSSPVYGKRGTGGGGSASGVSNNVTGSKKSNSIAGGYQYTNTESLNAAIQAIQMRPGRPLAMSSSGANIPTNGYGNSTNSAINLNTHISASPAISPASSLCSSEMNLSQELQNHPLFKMPIVDRSLKPSSSLDLNHRITTSRTGGPPPARPPLPSAYTAPHHTHISSSTASHNASQVLYTNHSSITQTPSYPLLLTHNGRLDAKPPAVPRTARNGIVLPIHHSTPRKLISTADSLYDTPPDMQSPPVPPRRQAPNQLQHHHHSDSQQQTADVMFDNDILAATAAAVHAGIHRLERNCWRDYEERSLLKNEMRCSSSSNASNTSSSGGSSASFVSALSHLTLTNEGEGDDEMAIATTTTTPSQSPTPTPTSSTPTPTPAPRHKKNDKESLRSLQPHHMQSTRTVPLQSVPSQTEQEGAEEDTMNDLISLDDSANGSFDLEDFDPLNQNARPLPTTMNVHGKSTTLPTSHNGGGTMSLHARPIASMKNPVHPFYTPRVSMLQPPSMKPPPLPTSLPPSLTAHDDDFELLRKYGLDQFSLTTTSNGTTPTSNGNKTTIAASATNINNWMTFD